MPALLIRFPSKRYHATPWGHHVNEGQIEWPPSPWRLLRALLATGYAKCDWPADGPPETGCTLIEKLASILPQYHLPSVNGAHSRHYMPLAIIEKGREKTTLIFDTWAQINKGVLIINWDIELTDEEKNLLKMLAENLNYLGRSESWANAQLLADTTSLHNTPNAFPCESADRPGAGWEQVVLLAPISLSDYTDWRDKSVSQALSKLPNVDINKKKLTKAEQKKINTVEESYPPDLIACLQVQTSWLQKLGWSQPPGSRRVLYWRRTDTLVTTAPKPIWRKSNAVPVEAILLSIATASNNDHALPNITRTLPQAELLHRALNAKTARTSGHSIVLSGCDSKQQPLQKPHEHAHLLHLDLDNDSHLDHVLIWAPMGLDADAQSAIRAVRQTFTKGGAAPLRLAIAAKGSLTDFTCLKEPYGMNIRQLINPAKVWRSQTPFVPPRYLKKRGRNTLEGQISAELESRELPQPASIAILDLKEDPSLLRYRHFVRARRFGPAPPVDCGFVVELRFDKPICGPIVLGYGCHFGLGIFVSK